jgi:hypothetical protein
MYSTWRQEAEERIAKKSAEAQLQLSEIQAKARSDLEEFFKSYNEKVEETKNKNR